MIISIEGHDGIGKTTLAKALAEELGFEYVKTPLSNLLGLTEENCLCALSNLIAYNDSFFTAWFLALNDMYALKNYRNKNVIFDRHILLNCYWNYNDSTKKIFDISINYGGKPDLVILLTASKETRISRLKIRNLSDKDLDEKIISHTENEKLIRFLQMYDYKYIIVDVDNLDKNEVLAIVRDTVIKQFSNF